MIKIPKEVNISGIGYVVSQDKDDRLNAISSFGEIDYDEREIRLLSTLDNNRKAKILLHELAHGILFESGHIRRSEDEGLIDLLTNVMFGLFIDNKFEHE